MGLSLDALQKMVGIRRAQLCPACQLNLGFVIKRQFGTYTSLSLHLFWTTKLLRKGPRRPIRALSSSRKPRKYSTEHLGDRNGTPLYAPEAAPTPKVEGPAPRIESKPGVQPEIQSRGQCDIEAEADPKVQSTSHLDAGADVRLLSQHETLTPETSRSQDQPKLPRLGIADALTENSNLRGVISHVRLTEEPRQDELDEQADHVGAERQQQECAEESSTQGSAEEAPNKAREKPEQNAEGSSFQNQYSTYAAHEEDDPEKVVRSAKEIFGDTLPKDYLSAEEKAIYYRLYGEPLRKTSPQDVGMPHPDMDELKDAMRAESGKGVLLRETEGVLEEVQYPIHPQPQIHPDTPDHGETPPFGSAESGTTIPPSMEQLEFIHTKARNKREYDALLELQRDFEAAAREHVLEEAAREQKESEDTATKEEQWDDLVVYEPNEPVEELAPEDMEISSTKFHPYTETGKFGTTPRTILLPMEGIVQPITELLKRTNVKHVRMAAENCLGGPGLPHSPATRRSKHGMYPQLPVGLNPSNREMGEIDADAFISTVFPFNYATSISTLTEVRKRMGSGWIRSLLDAHDGQGPRILDYGSGGAGAAAWEDVLQAEWDVMREKGEVKGPNPDPHGRKTVVVGSDTLRYRISRFLNNTTFLPRIPDYVHSHNISNHSIDSKAPGHGKKSYDLIIASNVFMRYSPAVNSKDSHRRGFILDNLWSLLNSSSGILLVIEKGHPRGFEEVADVRRRLLENFICPGNDHSKNFPEVSTNDGNREPGRIIAPCTNHTHCPMYLNRGVTEGRHDFCHFKQRFIRPHFLQRVLEAKHHNHEDVQYSYLAVQRGVISSDGGPSGREATERAFKGYADSKEPPHAAALPRNIMQPLKRTGHVIFDLCTPEGKLERWTLPRSFNKQAYHDARKAKWGDLWALGAKTRVNRTPRLGSRQSLKEAMLKRVYRVEKVIDEEGNEKLIVPALKTAVSLKKKVKAIVNKRTSRHNRRIEFQKEIKELEREDGSRASDVRGLSEHMNKWSK